MKNIYLYLLLIAIGLSACKKPDYISGTLSPIIAISDLKAMYKGSDVALTTENLLGASKIIGVVISDATSGNAPAGVLVIQNYRRNLLRGISLVIGASAANYSPGDSVIVQIEGATLTKINGPMQIMGLSAASVTKVASNQVIKVLPVNSDVLITSPDVYESTLVSISKALTEPEPAVGETYLGNKILNDGFGTIALHTQATASFANIQLPFGGNFIGIPLMTAAASTTKMQLWIRTIDDVHVLSTPKPSACIITGFLADPLGNDGNYEYIQLMAAKDIDFSITNFSLVTTNNAGASTPAGFPVNGWATGGLRTYKFNLTSGTVSKGEFFYVGGNKNIDGAGSSSISGSKWIGDRTYASIKGDDFGDVTGNLLANSGNIAGIAVFNGINVDVSSVPLDIVMFGGNGSLYAAGPPEIGYRITDTDHYSLINPTNEAIQSFYLSGTNSFKFGFPGAGSFAKLGGIYQPSKGRWINGRTLVNVPLTATSQITDIETGTGFTSLSN